jgi:uncharacterized membrane protein YeiH
MATTALVALDLVGTFAFALNGAFTTLRATRLDIVGVVTLGMITALDGGTIRDVFLDSLPPATFLDWRYLAVAALGGLIAFVAGSHLERINGRINIPAAAGLSLFAVTGNSPAPTGWPGSCSSTESSRRLSPSPMSGGRSRHRGTADT